MKTLPLSNTIKDFKGEPILLNNVPWTLKDIVLHYLGVYSSQDGQSLINAYKLGITISNCEKPIIKIEDAEFLIIKYAVQKSQHGALVMGQVYEILEKIEKE